MKKEESKKKEEAKKVDNKNIKGKNTPVEVEIKPPTPKQKILERFIIITTYNDVETMKHLSEIFESINKNAFNLKSNKEIYTKILTDEEQKSYDIDFISGFQIIDSNIRITILEGLTGKAMKIVKEKIPKIEMNTSKYKIFSNSKILFDRRIYSKFGICLKFIKLRTLLSEILTTYDIYQKSLKYPDIYNSFIQLGFLLNSTDMKTITESNLFPLADHLLQLERKYGDILNDEDLTGIHIEKKKIKNRSDLSINNITHEKTQNKTTNRDISKVIENKTLSSITHQANTFETIRKKPLDSHNLEYFKYKEAQLFKQTDFHLKNLETIKKLNSKPKTDKFIKDNDEIINYNNVYNYSFQRKNQFNQLLDEMRKKYQNDKNSYYTYSKDYLSLSFPVIIPPDSYKLYLDNKKKWFDDKDFDRYKQPGFDFRYKPYKQIEL